MTTPPDPLLDDPFAAQRRKLQVRYRRFHHANTLALLCGAAPLAYGAAFGLDFPSWIVRLVVMAVLLSSTGTLIGCGYALSRRGRAASRRVGFFVCLLALFQALVLLPFSTWIQNDPIVDHPVVTMILLVVVFGPLLYGILVAEQAESGLAALPTPPQPPPSEDGLEGHEVGAWDEAPPKT